MENKPSVQQYWWSTGGSGLYVLFTDYDALAKRLERAEELLSLASEQCRKAGWTVIPEAIDAFLNPAPAKEQ